MPNNIKLESLDIHNKTNNFQVESNKSITICQEMIDIKENDCEFEIAINKNAKLNLTVLNTTTKMKSKKIKLVVKVLENSELNLDIYNLNNQDNDFQIIIDLNEKEAKSNINILDISRKTTKNQFDIKINNNAVETESNINFKSVMKNNSTLVANIECAVKKDAQNCSNFQTSKALLLDEISTAQINPILLIDNPHVKAGHSASVSRISDNDLYYLMSRAISRKDAQMLLTMAFIDSIVSEMKNNEIKDEIIEKINNVME